MSTTKLLTGVTLTSGTHWIYNCEVYKCDESDYYCNGNILGFREAVIYLNRIKRNRAVMLKGFFFRNMRWTPEARHVMETVKAVESDTLKYCPGQTKLIYLLLMAGY